MQDVTLGMGGFSIVKLGEHRKTQKKAALKIMFADKTGALSKRFKRAMTKELNVLKTLKHENVIHLIAFDEDAEYPESNGNKKKKCCVIVLEYACHGDLYHFIKYSNTYFDEKATRSYFHQMVNGVEALHKLGIAHRDLKPGNMLLDENFVLKIADFGFASNIVTKDSKSFLMYKTHKGPKQTGTRGYLPPEVLNGEVFSPLKCDIFALGVVLFTTFMKYPPFNNVGAEEEEEEKKKDEYWVNFRNGMIRSHVMKQPAKGASALKQFWDWHEEDARKVNPNLKKLLQHMMHPDPELRYDIQKIQLDPDKWYNPAPSSASSASSYTYSKHHLQTYMQQRWNEMEKARAAKIEKKLARKEKRDVKKHDVMEPKQKTIEQ